MTDVDLAAAAMMLDCEGCLSVSPYVQAGRTRFHCDIFVGMQNRAVLEFFQQVVRVGSISRRSDCWMYQTSGAKAARAVKMLLPYLRVKREAASLFVEFAATFNSHGQKPTPTDVVEKRHDLSKRIRAFMKADSLSFRSTELLAVEDDPAVTNA